jgi:hypothetical protein
MEKKGKKKLTGKTIGKTVIAPWPVLIDRRQYRLR